jgi:trigger factor
MTVTEAVTTQAPSPLQRRLEVEVPGETVDKAFDARLKNFSRQARLKGFRPGKAPLSVVKRQFGAQIREEVVNELVRDSLGQALNEHKLSPVGGPQIEPLPSEGSGLRFAAHFEVFPEVTLSNLGEIEVTKLTAEVTPADVDAMIETLRKQRPNWVLATRPAVDGDRLTVDFEGRLEGVPFEGGTGTGVEVILGSGRMIKDFEAGLTGMQAGETKVLPVVFPADYGKAELAGKTTEFTITVQKHELPELPLLDDAFCEAFGVAEGGIEALQAEVEENMRRELADNIRAKMKAQVLDKLLAAHPLELPRVAVENEIRQLQIDWLRRIGANLKELKQAPPREPFEESARRRVAVGLLIGEVITRQGLTVDTKTLEERIETAAISYADPEAAARQIAADERLRNQFAGGLLEDQAVEWLIGQMKVVEQPATFKELMNFGA